MTIRALCALLVGIVTVACTAADPSASASRADAQGPVSSEGSVSATDRSSDAEAAESSRVPSPVCAKRPSAGPVTAPHEGDGTPDPDGRIVFGRMTRVDHVKGQIVSLHAVDADGSDMEALLECEVARPRISPDGTRIAFAIVMDDGSFQIATVAADGSDLRILTATPGYAETPDWSADGSWLIYSHASRACVDFEECVLEDGNLWNLWRMSADGSDQRLIGNPDTFDWEPRLSPDGTEVVFSRFDPADDFSISLVIRDLATGEERMVTTDDRNLEHPDWSPDGRWIVYNPTDCGACQQIERVPVDDPDAAPEVLYPADATHAGFKPVYSPDGSAIAFGCRPGLCRMSADGSGVVMLAASVSGIELNHLDWGP
jgi:TolB protein